MPFERLEQIPRRRAIAICGLTTSCTAVVSWEHRSIAEVQRKIPATRGRRASTSLTVCFQEVRRPILKLSSMGRDGGLSVARVMPLRLHGSIVRLPLVQTSRINAVAPTAVLQGDGHHTSRL